MRHTLVLASLLGLAPFVADAAELDLPGALDLSISGEVDFEVEYIDSDFEEGLGADDEPDGRQFFFNQDHEIRFRATGVADATGIEYGANLELELQTGGDSDGTNANWDEAWSFIRGGWGELRFGNEDGPAELLSFTAADVAYGTDGVDGDLRVTPEFVIEDSEEATKIIYFTPSFAGLQGGASYTINADDSGSQIGTTEDAQDIINVVARYEASLADVEFGVSGAGVFIGNAPGTDATANWAVGALVEYMGIGVAGYYGMEEEGFARADLNDSPRERVFNIGVGGQIAAIGVSFNYQQDSFEDDSDQSTYIIGVTVPILPGVAIRSDVAYQDQDAAGDADVEGINALAQFHVEF